MAKVVIQKNMAINFNFITLRSIIASGKLKAATAIIKASAVPNGKPFWNKTIATGRIAAQLPYKGTPKRAASGTEKNPALPTIPCTAS